MHLSFNGLNAFLHPRGWSQNKHCPCSYRHLKNQIRRSSYKIALRVDESDEITNPRSRRTLATLNCFRKASYKLLMTGTVTRNTINESYSQFELLYNNSKAFMCNVATVYQIDKEGRLRSSPNTRRGQPFPPYYGNALFHASFCPVKKTDFGIKKDNQDLFNREHLAELINKSTITRKFEEIVGEKKYHIHLHEVRQLAGWA